MDLTGTLSHLSKMDNVAWYTINILGCEEPIVCCEFVHLGKCFSTSDQGKQEQEGRRLIPTDSLSAMMVELSEEGCSLDWSMYYNIEQSANRESFFKTATIRLSWFTHLILRFHSYRSMYICRYSLFSINCIRSKIIRGEVTANGTSIRSFIVTYSLCCVRDAS